VFAGGLVKIQEVSAPRSNIVSNKVAILAMFNMTNEIISFFTSLQTMVSIREKPYDLANFLMIVEYKHV
jgi:hypothetical protein